jgi:hypothetical protein
MADLRDLEDSLRAVPKEALIDGPPPDADLLLPRTLKLLRGPDRRPRSRRQTGTDTKV